MILVLAMTKDGLIGDKGKLPWHLKKDLQFFKNLTEEGTVIMGRGTAESLGKPLPNRNNIYISREPQHKLMQAGFKRFSNVRSARMQSAAEHPFKPVFLIGGAKLVADSLEHVKSAYITYIDGEFEGDTYLSKEVLEFLESGRVVLETSTYDRGHKLTFKNIIF